MYVNKDLRDENSLSFKYFHVVRYMKSPEDLQLWQNQRRDYMNSMTTTHNHVNK
jgi:hypothetical protein